MGEPSKEVIERMMKFIRNLASSTSASPIFREAAVIEAMLPDPVDPDMIEAREVVCEYHHDKYPESVWHNEQAASKRAGCQDQMLDVQAAYFGIKRGRELARSTDGGQA